MLECSLPVEVILFIAFVLDGSYEIIFQAFILERKCIETATFNTKFASETTRNNSAWICTVGIKNNSIFLQLEAYSSASASIYVLYSGLCRLIPAFLVMGIIGSIGDLYSRKIAILIPTVGITIRLWIDFVVANFLPFNLYPLILVGELLFGLCGGPGIEATCLAYVAHQVSINRFNTSEHASSNEESTPILQDHEALDKNNSLNEGNILLKNVRLALLTAIVTMGYGIGVLFGGIFVAILGSNWSFAYLVCLATMILLLCVYGVKDLPIEVKSENESSLASSNVEKQESKNKICGLCENFLFLFKYPFELLANAYYTVFCKPRPEIGPYGRLVLILIMLCLWIYSIIQMIEYFLNYLYFTLSPRSFTPFLYGVYNISDSTLTFFSILIILSFIYYIFRNQDPIGMNVGISCFGIIATIFSLLILGLSKSQLVVFLSILFDMFVPWTYAGLRVIIGHLVSSTEVGKIVEYRPL